MTGGSGQITSVELNHGGSGYGIGMTMSVSGSGVNGVVQVTGIDDAVGKAIQVIGVGSVDDRNNSDYNGLFKVVTVPSTKSVGYYNIPEGGNAPCLLYTSPSPRDS